MEMTEQWSIKYRPHTWEDIYGQDQIVKALRKRILEENYGKAIILEGMYGCGKSTIAQIYAAAIMSHDKNGNPNWDNVECKPVLEETFTGDVMRLDGGMFSGKSDMIEMLAPLNKRPLYSKDRVIIIEEADQLSGASVNALLKTLEDPHPWNHFILLSMLDKKGIPAAIKSRAQTYKVNPLGVMPMMMALKHILEQEDLWNNDKLPTEFKMDGLKAISEASKGSLRSGVQYLEKCLMNEAYDVKSINDLLQVVDETATWQILDGLLDKSKDRDMWTAIMNTKTGDEAAHLYNYMTMLLSEAIICKETGYSYEETHFDRLNRMGNHPNCEDLYYCLTLHPQMNKDYIRTTDILGALACYYQGMNFKPTSNAVIANAVIKDRSDFVKQQLNNNETVRLRETVSEPAVRTRKI